MPGRLSVSGAAPLLESWEKRNSWRLSGTLLVRGLPASRALALPGPPPVPVRFAVCCPPLPPAAMAAVAPVPGTGSPEFAGCFRGWRRGLLRGQQDIAAPLGWAMLGVRALAASPWLGGGATTGLLFPALPLNSPSHRSRSSRPATPGTSSRSLPPERKSILEAPADPLPPLPVPRRESPVVGVAVPPRRPRLAGTDASTAPPLPPTPLAVGAGRCGLRLGSFALPGRCSLRPHVTWRRTAAPSPFTWQVARHSPQCGRLRCKIQLPSARPHVY